MLRLELGLGVDYSNKCHLGPNVILTLNRCLYKSNGYSELSSYKSAGVYILLYKLLGKETGGGRTLET